MNLKKYGLASLTGFLILAGLSGLWHVVLMNDYYRTNFADVERADPIMSSVIISFVVLALLLAYIYPHGFKGKSPAIEGMRFGLVMGIVTSAPTMMMLHGAYKLPLAGTLVDIAFQIVQVCIAGTVIGLIYGKTPKKVSE